jgi:hypothetical protein
MDLSILCAIMDYLTIILQYKNCKKCFKDILLKTVEIMRSEVYALIGRSI